MGDTDGPYSLVAYCLQAANGVYTKAMNHVGRIPLSTSITSMMENLKHFAFMEEGPFELGLHCKRSGEILKADLKENILQMKGL